MSEHRFERCSYKHTSGGVYQREHCFICGCPRSHSNHPAPVANRVVMFIKEVMARMRK